MNVGPKQEKLLNICLAALLRLQSRINKYQIDIKRLPQLQKVAVACFKLLHKNVFKKAPIHKNTDRPTRFGVNY